MRSRVKQKAIYFAIDQTLVRRHHTLKLAAAFLNVFFLIIVLAISVISNSNQKALAASYTWDGGGTTNNWSDCDNWSTNICPVAADSVTFNGTSTKDSTVDAGFGGTVTTLNINPGYSGTIDLARSLAVSGSFTQSSGIFTAGSQGLDFSTFTLNSGANFTASSDVATFSAAFTINASAVFNHNNGTVVFDGGSSGALACGNQTFHLVDFAQTNSTKTVGADCNLPLGDNPTIADGATGADGITLDGTLSGSGTLTVGLAGSSAALTIRSTGVLSGFDGLHATSGFRVSGATVNLGSYAPVDIDGSFILDSGTIFTAPTGIISVAGAFDIDPGATFTHNNGTLSFDGSGGAECDNTTFNLVVFQHTTGTRTIGADCNFPVGNDPTLGVGTSADIILNGTLTGAGTLTIGAMTSGNVLTLNSSAALTGFDGLAAGAIAITDSSIDFTSYTVFGVAGSYAQTGGNITVPDGTDFNGNFTLNSGSTFTAPAGQMAAAAGFTINSGATFNHNNGTLIFDGSSSATLACNNQTFHLVSFTHTANTKTIGVDCNLPLGNNPTLGIGSGSRMSISGTVSGTGTLAIGTAASGNFLTLDSTATLVGFTGLQTGTLTTTASIDFSSYTLFALASTYTQNGGSITVPDGADFNGAFTLNSGSVFTAPSDTMTVAGNFTINAGATFNHNNGAVSFDGSTATLACNNTIFNLVVFAHTSGGKTVSSDCTLPLGHNPTLSPVDGDIRVQGEINGTGHLQILGITPDGSAGRDLTIDFNGQVVGFDAITVGHNFNIFNGAIVDFSTLDGLNVGRALTIRDNSSLIAPILLNLSQNLTLESGSAFSHNSGTVLLDGTGQTITGDITFYNLTKTITAPDTLTFTVGSTQTIEGDLIFEGADADNLLSLVSSTPGTQWNIDAQGPRTLQYLSVQDSNNINASAMLAYDSEDLGNNINWQFLVTPLPPNPTNPSTDPNADLTGVLAETGEGRMMILVVAGLGIAVGVTFLVILLRRQKR